MRIQVTTLLAAAVSPAFAHEGHHHHADHSAAGRHHHHDDHNDMLPHTHIAFHHVESACASDVESLCAPQQEFLKSTGDPLLDWVLLPMAPPPPEMEDLSRFMDQMMNSLLVSPVTEVSVYWFEEPTEQAPILMMDSLAAKLASDKEPEEIPALAEHLQSYGELMIAKHEADSMGGRMARRLTEMDATSIQHSVRLPFGCAKNRCLTDAHIQNKVSDECAHSIRQLEGTYKLETELEYRQEVFVGMVWIYISVLGLLLILLGRRYSAKSDERRMRIRILQAVYSNPALKQQVEQELGESVGNVPPLPYHVLKLISKGGKDFKRHISCLKGVRLFFFTMLLVLVFASPFSVLPICIGVSLLRVFHLCLFPGQVDRECECCCCGASTTDAARGNLTEAQACCNCCKGTGVCAPSCASCCCCCGCTDDSCCCMKNMKSTDDCTCCCCGATSEQVRDGTLTEAQVCCNCCKGTGTCDPSCAACCKPTKKGRGQKHTLPPKHAIYEGVPIQVV